MAVSSVSNEVDNAVATQLKESRHSDNDEANQLAPFGR
jgi:hypothetical protein